MSHHFILQPSPTHNSSSLHYDGPSTAKIPRKSSSQTPTSHRRIRHSPFSSTLSTRQPSSPFITVLTGRTLQRAPSDNDTLTTPRLRIDKLLEQDSKLHNLSKETDNLTPSKSMAKPRKSLSTFGALTARAQTPTIMDKSSYLQTKSSWNASPGSKSMLRLTSLSKSISRSGIGYMDGSRYCSPRKLNRVEKAIVKVQDIIDGCDRIKEENADFGKTMRLQIEQEVSNSPRSQKSPKSPGLRLTEEKEKDETPRKTFTFWKTNEGFRQERAQLKQELQKQRDEELRKEELRKQAEEEAAFRGTCREVKGKKPINLSEIQEPTGMTKFILQKPRLFQGTKPPLTTRRAERLLFDPPKAQNQVQDTSPDPPLNIQGQILTKLALRPSTSLTVATHKERDEKKRAAALLAFRKVSDESSSQLSNTLSSPLIKPLRRVESGEMSPSSLKVSPILKGIRKESAEDGNMFLFRANSIEKKGTLFDLDAVKEGEDYNRPSLLYNSSNNVLTSRRKGGTSTTNPVLKKTASMVLAETLAKVEGRKVKLEVDPNDLFMSHKKGKFKGKNGSIQDVYRTPVQNSRNIL